MWTRARSHAPERGLLPWIAVSALLPGCVTCTWRDRALAERNDLATPALAFESFRAAIRCDDSIAGYRVISEEMKARHGLTVTQFVLGWDALFDAQPLARLAGSAEVVSLAQEERRAWARVSAYGSERTILFVRQDFFAVKPQSEPLIDGFVPAIDDLLRRDGDSLVARIADSRFAETDSSSIRSLRVETEWKIADFLEKPPPAPPLPAIPQP